MQLAGEKPLRDDIRGASKSFLCRKGVTSLSLSLFKFASLLISSPECG